MGWATGPGVRNWRKPITWCTPGQGGGSAGATRSAGHSGIDEPDDLHGTRSGAFGVDVLDEDAGSGGFGATIELDAAQQHSKVFGHGFS